MPDPKPEEPILCHHLAGYWINRGVNFRCYECGYQFHVAEIPADKDRKIETLNRPCLSHGKISSGQAASRSLASEG
jgi:hypothetical protein